MRKRDPLLGDLAAFLRSLLAAAVLLGTSPPAWAASRTVPAPDVIRVSPQTAATGQTTALVLAVKDFSAERCSLDFGEGTAVVPPVQSLTADSASLRLQVSSTAPLGRHDIWISCTGSSRKKATVSLTLTAGAPRRVTPPDILVVTPSSLKQGASYTLALQVSNFGSAAGLSVTGLDFGSGIKGTRVPDTQPPEWKVAVSLGAPIGRHPITISYVASGETSTRTRVATASVQVEGAVGTSTGPGATTPAAPTAVETKPAGSGPAAVTEPAIVPKPAADAVSPAASEASVSPGAAARATNEVLALTPSSWEAGSTYPVALTGRGFDSGLKVRFGEGVTLTGAVQVISPTLARFTVAVAEDAAPGERVMEKSDGGVRPFAKTAVRAWVRAAPRELAARTEAAAPQALSADKTLLKGTITLIDPEPHAEEGAAFYEGWFNDATIFRWEEENPGVADTFELRLYAGEHLLMSREVAAPDQDLDYGPVPLPFYRPDAAFTDEILTRYFDVIVDGMVVGHPRLVEWQVIGYRTSTTVDIVPGSTPGASKKVKSTTRKETAASERRLLRIPSDTERGLACGVSGHPEGSRNNQYLVLQNKAAGSPPNYVGDTFELSGEVNLELLPIQANDLDYGSSGGAQSTVQLSNLFVDWGDGSGATSVQAQRRSGGNYLLVPQTHDYQDPGTHVARLFMLSSDDVQLGDPSELAGAVDKAQDQQGSGGDSGDYGGTSAAQIASRAVLLFCQSSAVIAKKDTVATGPLQLESIEITGSNGQGDKDAGDGPVVRTDLAAPSLDGKSSSAGRRRETTVVVRSDLAAAGSIATEGTSAARAAGRLSGGESITDFGECDSLQNTADLRFYGCGTARIIWYLEDLDTHERTEIANELTARISSPSRTDPAAEPKIGTHQLLSPLVRMRGSMVGKRYAVTVSARVAGNCEDAVATSGGKGSKTSAKGEYAASLFAESAQAAPSPALTSESGSAADEKPYFVESERFAYRVVANAPGQPCRFKFSTADGVFEVDTLRDVTKQGERYAGRGSLHLVFAVEQGKSDLLVDVAFTDWRAPDALTVVEGTLDKKHPASGELAAHGLLVTLRRLKGSAGPDNHLGLSLFARIPDGVFANSPPGWEASAPITPAGDWIAEGGSLDSSPVGSSALRLAAQKVVFDLSDVENRGDPGATCLTGQGPGAAWMGLLFKPATIVPDTFSLFPGYSHQVQGWGVVADGLCGQATMTGGFGRTNFKSGELGFDAIDLRVQQGSIKARYEGFYARVPPLYDAEFSGTAVFTDAPGQTPFVDWQQVKGPGQLERSFSTPSGRIIARSVNFGFGSYAGHGWGVRSDTAFTFEARHEPFATDVWVTGLVNDFDGVLFLEGGGSSVEVALGAGTVLGETPMTLDAVNVTGFGSTKLAFGFAAKVRISEKLGETPLPVGYTLERKSYSYAMRGPLTQSFVQEIVYNGGGSQGVATKVTLDFMQGDASGGGAHDTQIGECAASDLFCGATDNMGFMGASVSAEFRLGSKDGKEYFGLRASVEGLKITLPPCFMIFGIHGGLGYNFGLTAFLQDSLQDLQPDGHGDFVFVAGLQAGLASDPSLLSVDATLLISTGEQPMMTFKAWVLSPSKSESGDAYGFFTAGAGGFFGGLAGDKGVLGNVLRIQMPGDLGCYQKESVKEVVSCAQSTWSSMIYFGGVSDWYMYLGQNIEGKLITATVAGVFNAESYLTLKAAGGFAFGAKMVLADSRSIGGFRAGFSAGTQFSGAVMWPTPLGVKADGSAWAEVSGCYRKTCWSPGVNIWAKMEFSSAQKALGAGFSIAVGCPFPVSSVAFGFGLYPCCHLEYDVDWCDYGL